MRTDFKYNDGGRSSHFKGTGGDCVTRAITITTGKDYMEIYNRLAEGNATQRRGKQESKTKAGKQTALRGINTKRKWFKDYMAELGFKWVPTMQIGSGCKVHLCANELPKGKLILAVTRHYTTMINGVINDTFNPSRLFSSPYNGDEVKTNQFVTIANGMIHTYNRCVYGYWIIE